MGDIPTATNKTTQVLSADDHRHGLTAHSPLFNLVSGAGLIGVWGWANVYQALTTAQAIMMLLQLSVHVSSSMSAQDLLNLEQLTNDRYSGIASLIAWGVQVYLFLVAFPSDRAFLRAHKKNNGATPPSIEGKTRKLSTLKDFLVWAFLVGDILSDAIYAWYGGGDILTLFSPAGGARAFVAILFAAVMLGITLFVGQEGFHRFTSGLFALIGKA